MKKHYVFAFTLTLALVSAVLSGINIKAADNSTPGAVGSVVADFSLPDADGKVHSLASLKGKNGTVLIFVSVQCPVSNAYNETRAKAFIAKAREKLAGVTPRERLWIEAYEEYLNTDSALKNRDQIRARGDEWGQRECRHPEDHFALEASLSQEDVD